ncbi:hypothetical protein MAL1_00150 [Bacteriophage DSS3_MAL1]|nr:hypothetical protein MAL1_00150 [Bacteriophage DSS3_MAL1]
MLSRLTSLANSARASVVDAVSSVDLNSVKGQLATTVSSARDIAASAAEKVTDRVKNPADAYDFAIDNMIEVAATIDSIDDKDLEGLALAAEALKEGNPYR